MRIHSKESSKRADGVVPENAAQADGRSLTRIRSCKKAGNTGLQTMKGKVGKRNKGSPMGEREGE